MILKTYPITEEQRAQMFVVFRCMKYISLLFENLKNFSMWAMKYIKGNLNLRNNNEEMLFEKFLKSFTE